MEKKLLLDEVFLKYLKRLPSSGDYDAHGNKDIESLTEEILNCDEYKKIKSRGESKHKIAILVSGHIRHNQFFDGIHQLNGTDFDIFIHTWDNLGYKGNEVNLNDEVNPNLVESAINKIPNVKSYKIENNKNFILNLSKTDNVYFNWSSQEKFIKSQLYSVNQSFKIFDEYRAKNGIKYDLVIRTRFENVFTNFNLGYDLIDTITDNKIIFTPNSDCGHDHMDSNSTTCLACETLFKKHNKKIVHSFDHTNVICDLFAYGSFESMKHYCSLYDFYDIINKKFEEKNFEILSKNNINYTIEDGVYVLERTHNGHLDSLYYINCSYPERLLQFHLKDYILPSSEMIRFVFKR